MPSRGPVARCDDLVKVYRTPSSEVRALSGITAEFPPASLVAVVGPSGSGKSTLLRLLAGMDHPTSGAVQVEETRVDRASPRRLRLLRRRSIGYVFQRPSDNLLPYLTVRDHLRLATRRTRGVAAADPRRLAEHFGIASRLDHLPEALSGGEQQRAALAQVLGAGATLVLADEPTAELDSASGHDVLEAMRRLTEAGVAFVVATHDPAVRRAADGVVELDHGRIRGAELPAERVARRRPARGGPERWTVGYDDRTGDVVAEVHGVGKTYHRGTERVHALRDVGLAVRAGELVGLVGRSGSGKTTLLNVIGGWEPPDAGRVVVAGRPDGRLPWSEVAVLPQKFGLIDELTVRANVEYPARLAARLPETEEQVDELLHALGLLDLQDRYPRETSVGEQQRATLARALALSPRLLLADEPTGHQDDGWTRGVLSVLRSAATEGTACLVATHNERLTTAFDRVLPMADGRVSDPS